MEKIGLIAGNRKFPALFAEAAKEKGHPVICIAIKGETSPLLKKYADRIYWLHLKDYRRIFTIFKKEGVRKVVMVGQISPRRLFSREVRTNPELRELLTSMQDHKAGTIFGGIVKEMEEAGFELIDSTTFVEEQLPAKGTLTIREPTFQEWEDIYFGISLAKQIAHLDIGQTVAVKNKAIVGVEAFEGTDNLIRRAGSLAGKGIVVVKVSRPRQDMRFDIPVVGLNTLRNLINASASCLAIEAGKTLFIDKIRGIALANRKGFSIVAV
ncbi:MAG: LpxI family protein [Candidatus Omnitrophota bacterium]|jgi:DUF1009 family protein|nr:MAG: LpxI family protein [Candidatus Omnitrophota bacterium]